MLSSILLKSFIVLLLPFLFTSTSSSSSVPFLSSQLVNTTQYLTATTNTDEFETFVKLHNKLYKSSEEKTRRLEIYMRNKEFVASHNAKNTTFKLALNVFADMTNEEFEESHFKGYRRRAGDLSSWRSTAQNLNTLRQKPFCLPPSVNWVERGCVTPVKDQKRCGACWAFSSVGAVEAAYCIKHGVLLDFSEQQLLDCTYDNGIDGCRGGHMTGAFQYMIQKRGLCLQRSYPYTAFEGYCRDTSCNPQTKVLDFVDVPRMDGLAVMLALYEHGPLTIAIETNRPHFQFYQSGIFNAECGTNLDHAALLVGYGTDVKTGRDYWLVKNSWGSGWGEGGYIKLERGMESRAGPCGILMEPSYPIVA